MLKVINEESRKIISKYKCIRGVVYQDSTYIEFGYFQKTPNNILVGIYENGDINYITAISKECLHDYFWSNYRGIYIIGCDNYQVQLNEVLVFGNGNFPYKFPKNYEAKDNFSIFAGKQKVFYDSKYPLVNFMPYSFGIEYETSMGYIPQEICYRDGLIPLRDGSISGLEYSTVVLKGNEGINLLQQQVETLKKYTRFNKECALHIHFGNYPVKPEYIYALYYVWKSLNFEISNIIPKYSFTTEYYKANGKSYCKPLPSDLRDFSDLYYYLTKTEYTGDLYIPHPKDPEHNAKWNIKTRYHNLNLINMVCYDSPKTVEFRFLRPTYCFNKILAWLYILNAILRFSEDVTVKANEESISIKDYIKNHFQVLTLNKVIEYTYSKDSKLVNKILHNKKMLEIEVINQTINNDFCGSDLSFESLFQ